MKAKNPSITSEYVKSILDYNPETGVFIWKIRKDVNKATNTINAGKVANCHHSGGYIRISIKGKRFFAHRLAWLYVTGSWPEIEIDHIDGDKKNNSFKNLRLATPSQNRFNIGARSDNKNGIKGVSYDKYRDKWWAEIQVNKIRYRLGRFLTKEEAREAYAAAAKKYHGEFARFE